MSNPLYIMYSILYNNIAYISGVQLILHSKQQDLCFPRHLLWNRIKRVINNNPLLLSQIFSWQMQYQWLTYWTPCLKVWLQTLQGLTVVSLHLGMQIGFPKLRGILGEGGKGKSNRSALTSCTSKLKTPVFHTRVSGVFIALTALSLEQALPLFPTCLKITEDYCSLNSASIYLF